MNWPEEWEQYFELTWGKMGIDKYTAMNLMVYEVAKQFYMIGRQHQEGM